MERYNFEQDESYIQRLREYIEKLEEENKFLKAEIELLKKPRFSDRYLKKLEEENKKLKADTEHTIKFNNKIIGKLKLENDKLKVIIKNNDIEQKADWKHIEELEEENKKIKEKLSEVTMIADDEKQSIEHILELEEENKKLKSDLDKFSEAYKRYRDYEKEELAESCYDLARENDKLKEELGKFIMTPYGESICSRVSLDDLEQAKKDIDKLVMKS